MAWEVGTDSMGRAIVCDRNAGGDERYICQPVPCMEDGLSATDVATLMAAAPALLRELKRLLALWEEAIGYEKDYMDMMARRGRNRQKAYIVGDRARAVIAKAEGRGE